MSAFLLGLHKYDTHSNSTDSIIADFNEVQTEPDSQNNTQSQATYSSNDELDGEEMLLQENQNLVENPESKEQEQSSALIGIFTS